MLKEAKALAGLQLVWDKDRKRRDESTTQDKWETSQTLRALPKTNPSSREEGEKKLF